MYDNLKATPVTLVGETVIKSEFPEARGCTTQTNEYFDKNWEHAEYLTYEETLCMVSLIQVINSSDRYEVVIKLDTSFYGIKTCNKIININYKELLIIDENYTLVRIPERDTLFTDRDYEKNTVRTLSQEEINNNCYEYNGCCYPITK